MPFCENVRLKGFRLFEKNRSLLKSDDFRECSNVVLKQAFKQTFRGTFSPANDFYENVGLICAFLRECPFKGCSDDEITCMKRLA